MNVDDFDDTKGAQEKASAYTQMSRLYISSCILDLITTRNLIYNIYIARWPCLSSATANVNDDQLQAPTVGYTR